MSATAWERFHLGEEPDGVRSEVLTSWRRSRISGVDPEHVEPPHVGTDPDTPLARVAVPILERMADLLVADRSCLALADARGGVLWRWVSEPMLRTTLDTLSVAQGFCFDESVVGTNGLGTALETGALAVVRGSEHFVHRFHDVTCVAAPVRHPITRRTVGAVNVTCRAEHTNPLLAVVVRRLVGEVEAALLDAASSRERALLDAFLRARRTTSGPVLAVGDDVVIANAAASALDLDHARLWEEVRGRPDGDVVTLDDLPARVAVVRDGTPGVALTVPTPRQGSGTTAAGPVRGTASVSGSASATASGSASGPATGITRSRARSGPRSDPWAQLADRAAALLARGPLVVHGEPGTGKATLLGAVLGLDPATVDGPAAAPGRLLVRHADPRPADAARTAGPLLVRHADLLPADALRRLAAHPGPLAVTAAGPAPAAVLGARTLAVPPLRRRDVGALAGQALRRHDPHLAFGADALVAMVRYGWPGNLRELARVVADAAERARGGVIGADALPAAVRLAAVGRALTPLERAEADTIAAVLAEHDGNKSAAARALGISRTALYAKLRAYRL